MTMDLNNADLDELDALLARTPEPLEPLDAVMLDGYLAGVAVQPNIVPVEAWLPGVFDVEGRPWPGPVDGPWLARARTLMERRFEVMTLGLAEDQWFDPVIVDVAQMPPPSEYDPPWTEAQRTLGPWIAGFQLAMVRFPALQQMALADAGQGDAGLSDALARVQRHAITEPSETGQASGPSEAAESPALVAPIAPIAPVAPTASSAPDVKAAVDDLLAAVAELWAMTDDARYRVPTIRRSEPKLGRNDPCHCGSGKKFKQCHGRGT